MFRDDPAALFEEPASRGEVNDWRQQWAHSPKQYDYAGTVAARTLGWGVDAGKLREHHCHRLSKIYTSDRAEIVWTLADVEAFNARAPEWVRRVLAVALETGFRPGDLIRLSWSHIEATPQGRRAAGPQGRRAAGPQGRRAAGPQGRRAAGSGCARTSASGLPASPSRRAWPRYWTRPRATGF